MTRRLAAAMAVGALALTALAVAPSPQSPAAGPCTGIHSPAKRHHCVESLMPSSYSIDAMGMPVYGGGSRHYGGKVRSVARLRGPRGEPDVSYTFTAALQTKAVAGRRQRVFTINGRSPGPTVYAQQGDLVRVVLHNRNIEEGTTIHWHGIDVPNGEDGVPGVTQNAVVPGGTFVYRFRAKDAGTYWYHSHQRAQHQVTRGLVGAVVIQPRGVPQPPPSSSDVVALVHSYGGRSTINGQPGMTTVGGDVASRRIRFLNTDQGAMHVASSVPFRVVAIDGIDVNGPTTLAPSTYVEVPAAGRVDLVLDGAATSARVGVVGGASLVLGGGTAPFTARKPLDPLHYGAPDPSMKTPKPDRHFNYVIGQRRGYLDGKYGNWFTIDHELIPDVPMFMVKPGDTVRVRFKNNTFVDHPMHLHGQHMLVLSRDGHASKGSPWWVDTLEVHPQETYMVQITADNPGVWMFHCHILAHAAQGLMTHLSYMNVRDPYRVGAVNHVVTNHPA